VSTRLVTSNIWPTLTALAKRSKHPTQVAVAYFGQGASTQLPLPPKSSIVVDASEAAVKSGQTCPAELAKLIKRGVRVYGASNLHAKIFVFGRKAYVGSANVSRPSAGRLIEAMVATTDSKTVSAAKNFVRSLCLQELGPKSVALLAAMYRPPRIPGGGPRRRSSPRSKAKVELPTVRIIQLDWGDPPDGSEDAAEAGRMVAAKRLKKPRLHQVDSFWWGGKLASRRGDIVIQVLNEGGGKYMVSPPGTVLHIRPWRSGARRTTFVYLEVPTRRRIDLEKLAKRLGRGAKKQLYRNGAVKREFAGRLLEVLNRGRGQ
jgi:hypothetical protein